MVGSPQFIIDAEGARTGLLLPIDEYESLLADLNDLALVAERRDEDCLSLDEVKAQLKADGLL